MNAISKATKAALLLFSIAIFLAGGAPAMRGQSALDGFDPNANGTINVIVVQPDGKILLGGDFTTLSPNGGAAVTRNRIARLNPDGTLDTAFNPNANNTVRAIALQADGKILVGGNFTGANSIGGQPRNRIARLEPITGSADSFDPNGNNQVSAIAVQADGKILVGGFFSGANSIGGQLRNRIARLDATSGLADSFDPNANGGVSAIAIQADGKIVVAGAFSGTGSIGGQTRNRIARLDATTGLADSFDPNANNAVSALAIQADGKILAGGQFLTNIGGQARNYIARLDATTGSADSFNPNPNNGVFVIAVQVDGKILVGGTFQFINGQSRRSIARLDATTGLPDSFDPKADNTVFVITVQSDGKILAGGSFTTFAPNGGTTVTRNRIARLETNGGLDRTLNLNAAGSQVLATAVQPDGKILIGGQFSTVLGVSRNNIARLNSDGTLDAAFNPNANNLVTSVALQADGKILVGGDFNGANSIGGQARNYIARLDATTGAADSWNPNANYIVNAIAVQADGKVLAAGVFITIGGELRNGIARLDATGFADSFDPNANGDVDAIAVQSDGKILVGGNFFGANSIGGQTRNYIARLDAMTGAADSFDPNASNPVFSIAVQPDGKILVGGHFSAIGGQTRNHTARLDATSGNADSFNPNANGDVYTIALQADGKILMGGNFQGIGGQTRQRIARLDATTGLADSFSPNASATVLGVAVQADGKILVAGFFGSIGGQTRELFARLNNDTIARQNLAVTQSAVTWTRSGSSPQFARVTFEYSTDNVTYTPLGDGTAAGNDWTLTDLSLPTGQNIYIRARGYYRSGQLNGSESITESIRNAFIPPPPTPTAVVSRKIHGGAGTFDINLPLTGVGAPGVECRSGGANNDYQIVFTFPTAVTFTGAAVSGGVGTVSNSSGSGTTTITLDLTGVTNAQRITITLVGASDGTNTGDLNVPMGVLAGDTTGNGSVNASDVGLTKLKSGQVVDSSNFRNDLNVNGSINASDVSSVKLKSGSALP